MCKDSLVNTFDKGNILCFLKSCDQSYDFPEQFCFVVSFLYAKNTLVVVIAGLPAVERIFS